MMVMLMAMAMIIGALHHRPEPRASERVCNVSKITTEGKKCPKRAEFQSPIKDGFSSD